MRKGTKLQKELHGIQNRGKRLVFSWTIVLDDFNCVHYMLLFRLFIEVPVDQNSEFSMLEGIQKNALCHYKTSTQLLLVISRLCKFFIKIFSIEVAIKNEFLGLSFLIHLIIYLHNYKSIQFLKTPAGVTHCFFHKCKLLYWHVFLKGINIQFWSMEVRSSLWIPLGNICQ